MRAVVWLPLGFIALLGVGAGGYLLGRRLHERAAERARDLELSSLVDHAIGKPAHCKSMPFGAPTGDRMDILDLLGVTTLERAQQRATTPPSSETRDNLLCEGEVAHLWTFIDEHRSDLCSFIDRFPGDVRVEALQRALKATVYLWFSDACGRKIEEREDCDRDPDSAACRQAGE
jgi:hypothetical protein